MTEPTGIDLYSIHGRSPRITESVQILVVGAGAAGISAALAAARAGARVLLIDENPILPATMGMDVPLHFGGRIAPTVRNRSAMEEQMLQWQPLLADAFEAGVDIRLGTAAWGIYSNRPDVSWVRKLTVGLVDQDRCWLAECDQIVVASGRRDAPLAFPGWDQPGVMGLCAAVHLATRYDALAARRIVVAGTTAETLEGCLELRRSGVEIAAIVEASEGPVAPPDLIEALRSANVEILFGTTLDGVESGADGVAAARLRPLDPGGQERTVECDSILIGVRAVPVVDLLASAGCRIKFDAARGGHIPEVDGNFETSIAGIFAVGDCAGIWPAKSRNDAIAAREGAIAAGRALIALGIDPGTSPDSILPDPPAFDPSAYWASWVKATILECGSDPVVCQCESVTAADILALRPPRYLGRGDEDRNYLRALGEFSAPNPDQVKRLTRAGMGLCQGRRCREQTSALLGHVSGHGPGQISLASYRAPVRPIPLSLMAEGDEPPEMSTYWDSWFGMPTQFQPFWENSPLYRASDRRTGRPRDSE